MKCEVCGAKIPLGKYECDNCGYRIPTKRVSSFNTVSSTHEHIESPKSKQRTKSTIESKVQTNIQLMQEELKEFKKNPQIGYTFLKKQEVSKYKGILGAILSIALFFGFLVPFIRTTTNFMNNEDKFINLTFEEVIDENYDDGTAQIALDVKNKIVDTFYKSGITDLDIEEYCEKNDGELYASMRISGFLDKGTYEVTASYNNSQPVSKRLFIEGESQISVADEFKGDQNLISGIGKALEVDSIVKSIDYVRELAGRRHDRNNSILEVRNTDPNVYIMERRTNSDLTYHYTVTYEEYI